MPTRTCLRQVFQNLISNSLKYTPRGEVTIGARESEEKGGVECWVSDNGTGIPEERLIGIFDRMDAEQEKESGLAVVKLYVEAHGGTARLKANKVSAPRSAYLTGQAPETAL